MTTEKSTVQYNHYLSLGKFSRQQTDDIFQKTGVAISCKLSPQETICMKRQTLFSGKNKKKCFNMSAEMFTQHAEH